jgi:hypothetical protein
VSEQKSIPNQIRQLILYISNSKGQVDGFAQELTFEKRLQRKESAQCSGFSDRTESDTTLWTTNISSKVNLPHANCFQCKFGHVTRGSAGEARGV